MSIESPPVPVRRSPSRASRALVRGTAFFGLWMLLMQSAQPADLAVGLLAAAGATWLSLRLLPPAYGRLRAGRLLALLPHFAWQSVLAGIDVARRALDPRMPLRTGFVTFRSSLPPGLARNTFATITSLLPGALAADEADDVLLYHCIDDTQSVAEQLGRQERRLARTLVTEPPHG